MEGGIRSTRNMKHNRLKTQSRHPFFPKIQIWKYKEYEPFILCIVVKTYTIPVKENRLNVLRNTLLKQEFGAFHMKPSFLNKNNWKKSTQNKNLQQWKDTTHNMKHFNVKL